MPRGLSLNRDEISLSGGTVATGQTTAKLVNIIDRTGTEVLINNLIQPGRPQALGVRTGSTSAWQVGGSAMLLVTGAVAVPQEVHVYVKTNPVYLIGSTVGSTYTGTTPAAYAKDATHVLPVRGMTYLHWRAETSGSTTSIAATVYGS